MTERRRITPPSEMLQDESHAFLGGARDTSPPIQSHLHALPIRVLALTARRRIPSPSKNQDSFHASGEPREPNRSSRPCMFARSPDYALGPQVTPSDRTSIQSHPWPAIATSAQYGLTGE